MNLKFIGQVCPTYRLTVVNSVILNLPNKLSIQGLVYLPFLNILSAKASIFLNKGRSQPALLFPIL